MTAISVIVPVYGTAAYLRPCLDSLLNQTFRDFEIIVINDGSPDESGTILADYQRRFPQMLHVLEQENHGISYTRNRGLREAAGEYVCFIDSDDYVAQDYLQALWSAADAAGADIAVCDYQEVTDGQQGRAVRIPDFPAAPLRENPRLLFDINASPWNKLYRRSFLLEKDLRFPEGLKYEDAAFVLPALLKANRLVKVNEELLFYRIREAGETLRVDGRVFDIFEILTLINRCYEQEADAALYREALEFFNINRLTVYNLQQISQKEPGAASRFIREAFAYLRTHFPHWRENAYFRQDNSWPERLIKTSPFLTRCYVKLMRSVRK